MTTPGESAGNRIKISLIASVPPVDAPININFSVEMRPIAIGALLRFDNCSAPTRSEATRGIFWIFAAAATRILSTILVASSLIPSTKPIRGLATKSTAPNSNAFIVTSAPRSVSVEIITTGMGRNRIKRPKKSRPSIFGISISSVMTSGSNSRIISRATSGSFAAPTHCISACLLMISANKLRTRAESSTTTTRIFFITTNSKKIYRATLRRLRNGSRIATPLLDSQGLRMRMCQALHQSLPRHREETNLARVDIQNILRHDRDALRGKIVQYKFGVALTDIHGGEAGHHLRPAKNLRLHCFPPGSQFQHFVD